MIVASHNAILVRNRVIPPIWRCELVRHMGGIFLYEEPVYSVPLFNQTRGWLVSVEPTHYVPLCSLNQTHPNRLLLARIVHKASQLDLIRLEV